MLMNTHAPIKTDTTNGNAMHHFWCEEDAIDVLGETLEELAAGANTAVVAALEEADLVEAEVAVAVARVEVVEAAFGSGSSSSPSR